MVSSTEQLTAVFRMFDERGDGEISCCELKKVFRILDPSGWPDSKLDPLLQAFDTGGNGHIGYEKFASWIMHDFVPVRAPAAGDLVGGEGCASQEGEDSLLLMIQRTLSRGPATVDAPLSAEPESGDAGSEAVLLRTALGADAGEPTTEPPTRRPSLEACGEGGVPEPPAEPLAGIDEEFLLTLQRSISQGPATVEAPLPPPDLAGLAPASETDLLRAALDTEPPADPPGWGPEAGDAPEEPGPGEPPETEGELLLMLQRTISAGPTALDAELPEGASGGPVSKAAVFHEAIHSDPATELPTREPSLEPTREEGAPGAAEG
mmetsp:Transcript_5038/g.14174  ORF Transcript_5038/g.14174 Transcript_5038/m.14174 type:complete len:321 (+) Transcript_5038:106-1068(+)